MSETEFTWVDSRWQENGWHEAFQLRLYGWASKKCSELGLKNDVFRWTIVDGIELLTLSDRGRRLTEIDPAKFSDGTAQMLAYALVSLAPESELPLAPVLDGPFRLLEDDIFSVEYSSVILSKLEKALLEESEA
ncbi:hypothetical protein [Aliiroseovarius sp. 2305UL8-7]|uniref:hypothetical protein n=1 Tax=Aliiroseovarius conchicola TaxID=3121637 RepID=UPI003527498F